MPRLSLFRAASTLAALLLAPALLPAQRPTTLAGRSTVYAPHGAVATSQPLACFKAAMPSTRQSPRLPC